MLSGCCKAQNDNLVFKTSASPRCFRRVTSLKCHEKRQIHPQQLKSKKRGFSFHCLKLEKRILLAANYNKNTNCNVNLVKGSVRVQSVGIYPPILVNGISLGLPGLHYTWLPTILIILFWTCNDQTDCAIYPRMQDTVLHRKLN